MVIGVNRFYISDIHIDYGTRIALGPMLPHAVTRKPGESPLPVTRGTFAYEVYSTGSLVPVLYR